VAKRIGELLVEAGVLSQQQLEQALFAQRKDGRKLGQLLIELGLVGEVQLTQTLSRQLSVPWVSLYHVDFSRSLLNLVPRAVAEKYSLVPIFVRRVRNQGETLYVAMDDPTAEGAIDDVSQAASLPVKPMIACPSDIRAAIRVYYLGEAAPVPAPPSSAPQVMGGASAAAVTSAPSPPASPRARGEEPAAGAERPRGQPAASDAPISQVAPAAPVRPAATSTPGTDAPAAASELQAQDADTHAPRRMRPRMISLTLLDGTTIAVPAPKKRPSRPEIESSGGDEVTDQLTARDLVSALRAVAHGADASEILGAEPQWEAMFSALLSILLRKGLIADWEFVEEFRKI